MKLAKLTAALVAAGLALPVIAAPDTATLQKLVERMEKLEARNAELEKQVKSLQGESEEIAKGLDSPRLSQYEPELTVRLKAVEKDALEMKKSASLAAGRRYTVASPMTDAPASAVPSLTVYETVPRSPGSPPAVDPETRSWLWPTASPLSDDPLAACTTTSLRSSTRPVGFDTAASTSTVASAWGRTNATTGAVASCAGASAASRVMRAVPVASRPSAETVTATR